MAFPPLKRPSVFIAAPGDMEYLREAARREFEALVGQAADSHDLEVYDYRYEIGADGFNDWSPAQEQIPLPSDPLCRAVICLLGEKIGTPLSRDFDVSPLGPLEQYQDNAAGVRLVHPWEEGADEQGGFALTGTLFEFLAARRSMQQQKRPPVLLLLVGDETIQEETDWMVTNWGGGRYRQHVEETHQLRHGARHKRITREWEDQHHFPQLRQLINLRRYLTSGSFVPNYVADEQQARERIGNFLRDKLDLVLHDATRTPFKGLEAYGQQDLPVFFGREAERKEAIGELARLWSSRERPNFLGVIGGSGVGKSSFARTALLGHLCHTTSEGQYIGCVMRTADLLDAADAPFPLRRVLELALAQIDPGADVAAALAGFARIVPGEQPAWVLEQLTSALRARGPQWLLLLAFDQFEELLDRRALPDGELLWGPVVRFIELAAGNDATGVIYTLQTNREELISQDAILGPLWARGGHVPLAFPMHSLEQIIREPFRVAQKIEVESGLVTELRRRIRAFAERCDPESQGSLLPLVSLTLTRIFNACGKQVLQRAAQPQTAGEDDGGNGASAKRRAVLLMPDCADLLDVETAIAQLADEALEEASSGAGADWSDDALGSLLRRLVRLRGSGTDRGRLELPIATLPASGAVRRLADAMLKRRLLIPEAGGRVKLVHEAVVRHWPKASKWKQGEERLLRLVAALEFRVEEWEAASRDAGALGLGSNDVKEVAEVLVGWFDVLSDADALGADAALSRLRDYGLALFAQHPAPLRVVEAGTKRNRHVHIAAMYGALDLLRLYISLDAQCVHAQSEDGRTPLFAPAAVARLDVLECLLEAGARVDVADAEGWRPLHLAANFGHWSVIERLCRAGVDPNATGGPWQLNALQLAAMSGRLDVLQGLLLRPDCDPDRAGVFGWTAMHLAAYSGQDAALRCLHAGHARLEPKLENDWTPLHAAASEGRTEAIRVLLELGTDPRALAHNDLSPREERERRPAGQHWRRRAWTSLHMAVSGHHAAAVTALLQGGAEVDAINADGDTPLGLAIDSGQAPTLRAVLAFKPDLARRDAGGRTPLQVTMASGRFDLAALVLEAGADIDAPFGTSTLLHSAARYDDGQRLRFLLQQGAAVDACDSDGMTALHLAAQGGHLDAARQLLDAGASPDLPDADGWTPLLLAAQGGHAALATALIDAGAAVRTSAARPRISALQAAAEGGHGEVLEVLLAHGARPDIDVQSADKAPPLVLAVRNGWFATALWLLDCGAAVPANVPAFVAVVHERHRQLMALEMPLPDEAHELLARLGVSAPVQPLAALSERFARHAAAESGVAARPAVLRDLTQYAWMPAAPDLRTALIASCNPLQGQWPVGTHCVVQAVALPWYGDMLLVRVTDQGWNTPGLAIHYLHLVQAPAWLCLDGAANAIYEANDRAPIRLDATNVLDYLRFFFIFVQGSEGPVHVLETLDDPLIPRDATGAVLEVLRNTMRPLAFDGVDDTGHLLCNGVLWYANAIVSARLAVSPSGQIHFTGQELIAGDLPVPAPTRLR